MAQSVGERGAGGAGTGAAVGAGRAEGRGQRAEGVGERSMVAEEEVRLVAGDEAACKATAARSLGPAAAGQPFRSSPAVTFAARCACSNPTARRSPPQLAARKHAALSTPPSARRSQAPLPPAAGHCVSGRCSPAAARRTPSVGLLAAEPVEKCCAGLPSAQRPARRLASSSRGSIGSRSSSSSEYGMAPVAQSALLTSHRVLLKV